ncbi:MAG: hypothetical protein ACN6OC_12875 [Alcaligenes sp.]
MNIQSPGQADVRSGRQRNLASDSMGAVGMMRFNAEQGSPVRAQHAASEQAREHRQAPWGREIHAQVQSELQQLQEKSGQAVHAKDRRAAARILRDLNALVEEIQQTYGGLPEEMVEDVRKLVNDSLSVLPDAGNDPPDPLNKASLQKLDDFSFVYVRQASSLLPFGLGLDLEAANEIGLERVEGLSRQLVAGMTNVFRTFLWDPVDMRMFLQQLRILSGVELQRTQQLMELGQSAPGGLSEDGRQAMAQKLCERAMGELLDAGQAPIVRNAMQAIDLLGRLEGEFGKVASRLENVVALDDYKSGGMKIMRELGATRHLLNGMSAGLSSRLRDLMEIVLSDEAIVLSADSLSPLSPRSALAILPSGFYRALREQYGVSYDPTEDRAVVLVTDSARASLLPELETVRPTELVHAARICVLPVSETEAAAPMSAALSMSEAFYRGAVEDGAIIVSAVRGADENGEPLHYTRPDLLQKAERAYAVGRSLDAFVRMAGAAAEPLTRVLTQETIGAAVSRGLQSMGMDSPFKLNDDVTVVRLERQGILTFDVAQTEDGGFRIATTVRFAPILCCKGMRPDCADLFIMMRLDTINWAEVQFTLQVPPDVQRIEVVELPQFRHRFDVEQIVIDNAVYVRGYAGHLSSVFE